MFWGECNFGSCYPSDQCSVEKSAGLVSRPRFGLTLRSFVSLSESRNQLSASSSALINDSVLSAPSWDVANTVYLKNTKPLKFLDLKEKSLVSTYYIKYHTLKQMTGYLWKCLCHFEIWDVTWCNYMKFDLCRVRMLCCPGCFSQNTWKWFIKHSLSSLPSSLLVCLCFYTFAVLDYFLNLQEKRFQWPSLQAPQNHPTLKLLKW